MEHRKAGRLFQGFLQGGFEASSHRRRDRRQLDLIAATRHDHRAAEDYRLLRGAGLHTVRDALRWHLIERTPGRYDWSSFLQMLHAARDTGTEVIWDLCHYGLPHDMDIWSAGFVDRFAAFAGAAARVAREEGCRPPAWCPMNEASFWSWIGGHLDSFYPYGKWRGVELKEQLVRAAIAATAAVLAVDPRARFVQSEPLIHIVPSSPVPDEGEHVEEYRVAQFEVWDMLAGLSRPDLGGQPEYLDVVGLNFYSNNQWLHNAGPIGMGQRLFRPLHEMMREVHARYGRPLMISETGAEGANGPGWLRYVGGEVRTALRRGIPVEGLCLYPVMDYPGWDDDRHCRSGLIQLDAEYRTRSLDGDMLLTLQDEAMLLRPLLADVPRLMVDLAAD